MELNKRKIGGWYEQKAADYLRGQGLYIKEMNYRCKFGEIDIIARDGEYLVFVEVKYRSDERSGGAVEAVNYWKRKIISRVAKYYLMTHYNSVNLACRFDVVGINGKRINWVKNAFEYIE